MSTLAPSKAEAAIARIAAIVGAQGVITDPAAMKPFVDDWRGIYEGNAAAVVRPGSVGEVAAVVKICSELRVPIVPQGGNTGMCMASVPRAGRNEIVLALGRMNRIRKVDPLNNTMSVEAGVVLAN